MDPHASLSRPWEALDRPQAFGDYTLFARLGRGGSASVFLGRKPSLDRWVAVKRLHPHLTEHEENIAMFQNEAKHLTRMDHHVITELLDYGFVDSVPYLVFPYLHGVTLNALLAAASRAGNVLPLPVVIWIFRNISSALHYAHKLTDADGQPLRLIHRDISPQNIFLLFDGRVMLLDFGIAKGDADPRLTHTGVLKGKIGYMSPEQAHQRDLDQRSDLFSLGIVMWESLTGKRLFRRENEILTLMEVTDGPIPRLLDVNPRLPEPLSELVDEMLRREPSERTPDAEQVLSSLDRCPVPRTSLTGAEHLSRLIRRLFPERIEPEDAGFDPGDSAQPGFDAEDLEDWTRPDDEIEDEASSAPTLSPGELNAGAVRLAKTVKMSPVRSTTPEVTHADAPAPLVIEANTPTPTEESVSFGWERTDPAEEPRSSEALDPPTGDIWSVTHDDESPTPYEGMPIPGLEDLPTGTEAPPARAAPTLPAPPPSVPLVKGVPSESSASSPSSPLVKGVPSEPALGPVLDVFNDTVPLDVNTSKLAEALEPQLLDVKNTTKSADADAPKRRSRLRRLAMIGVLVLASFSLGLIARSCPVLEQAWPELKEPASPSLSDQTPP